MKNKNNLIVGLLILMSLALVYNYFFISGSAKKSQHISYTKLLELVNKEQVRRISINGNLVKLETSDNLVYTSAYPISDSEFIKNLKQKNIDINVSTADEESGIGSFLIIAFVLFFVFLLIRSIRSGDSNSGGSPSGPGGAFTFGKSKAKITSNKDIKVTFADVAGVDEAKIDLEEVVDFLKNSKKFDKVGAKIPKGCLLVGAPGTGKTLLAKAVAGEAKVPFFSISGSDFVEMFVGVGASRVRDLFNQAKKHAPCIVFIDEIDAVGRRRGIGIGGGNDEREQTLNQLLVEMDGFSVNQGIIILAATNRPDVLDPALLRPGRFDRQVVVPLPDVVGRERILFIYLQRIPLGSDVDIAKIARGTTGFSGADLANLANEAALYAARHNKAKIDMSDIEEAKDKIIMGAARKSNKLSDDERLLTAYHEAGHALVAFHMSHSYPVHKITIIPRGRSLGVTAFLPERDEYSRSYQQLIAQIVVLFGGRVSEEMKFGKEGITTGAAMDIQMATDIARKMVTEWGFSDVIGRIRYSEKDSNTYISGSSNSLNASEQTIREIEKEIGAIVTYAENKATEILYKYQDDHLALSNALLENEVLSGDEAKKIVFGNVVPEESSVNDTEVVKDIDDDLFFFSK